MAYKSNIYYQLNKRLKELPKMKAILVLIAAIAFALSPFLTPDFGGIGPELYPIPQDKPPVQPAGWAFSIWGGIYIWLIIHAGYGFLKQQNNANWEAGRLTLLVSLAIGAIWLPVALVSPIWATILIWGMLITVLGSLYRTKNADPSWAAGWPVALYAGWLSAASFVSIGLLLAGYGILSEVLAAIVALTLATAFALYHQAKLKHWTYGTAVIWGFVAIAINNFGSQTLLVILALSAVALIGGLIAWQRKALF